MEGIVSDHRNCVIIVQVLFPVRLNCDYSLAKKLLGWKPKVSIDEGLRRSIEWAKENLI